MEVSEKIIAFADKTVMSIGGLKVRGLNTEQIEDILSEKLGTMVRVIGVTSDRIEMDVYGIDPEKILRDEHDVIRAVSCAEGISLSDLAQIGRSERIVEVDINNVAVPQAPYCARERWPRE